MTESLQDEGQRLIRESERIWQRDAVGALDDGDFNMAVRRAQEAVELALKGGLRMLGADYPRVHDVGPVFSEQLQRKRAVQADELLGRIEEVSLWLSQARAPAFYLERDYDEADARRAVDDASLVVEAVQRLLGIEGEPE